MALTFALALSTCAFAEVRLPALIGDNMVLQQGMDAHVWGWADAGERVSVEGSWGGAGASAVAGSDGRWMVELETPEAGGPYAISIEGENSVELTNVMVGEVWVCSGQSNMQMSLAAAEPWHKGVVNFEEEIAAADHPRIRLFSVERRIAGEPQDDCAGAWSVCSPETVAGFSGVAYFFGREVFEHTDLPIGLIHTSWGGTRAEAWTSRETLTSLGDYSEDLEQDLLDRTPENLEKHAKAEAKRNALRFRMDAENPGSLKGYAAVDYDDSHWSRMEVPQAWESVGSEMEIDGVVWFRKAVEIPESWDGLTLHLGLGPIDDCDTTYFNGVKLGSIGHGTPYSWQTAREYTVRGGVTKAGRNVLAVRVFDGRGRGGLVGKADQLTLTVDGDVVPKSIPLAGEWHYKVESVLEPNPYRLANSNTASVLYNGMIAPLIPYRIRGVIWYQGESNHMRAYQYRRLFPAMIGNWREVWGQGDFPFYYVQIAPFRYGDPVAPAELREAQLMALSVPNTGMAVTLDIGEVDDIHPRNKQDVGRRLALWALAETYGVDDLVYSGPVYRSMSVEGDAIRVEFDHVGGGLIARGGPLTDFTIAGEDREFVEADAVLDGDAVVVSAPGVKEPAAVRFGWTSTATPNLFNAEGLPASTFRTDDWPGVTHGGDLQATMDFGEAGEGPVAASAGTVRGEVESDEAGKGCIHR